MFWAIWAVFPSLGRCKDYALSVKLMVWRVDDAATICEHRHAIERDGRVEGVADEEIAVVEGCGEDFDFDFGGGGGRFWDVLEVESVQIRSIKRLQERGRAWW